MEEHKRCFGTVWRQSRRWRKGNFDFKAVNGMWTSNLHFSSHHLLNTVRVHDSLSSLRLSNFEQKMEQGTRTRRLKKTAYLTGVWSYYDVTQISSDCLVLVTLNTSEYNWTISTTEQEKHQGLRAAQDVEGQRFVWSMEHLGLWPPQAGGVAPSESCVALCTCITFYFTVYSEHCCKTTAYSTNPKCLALQHVCESDWTLVRNTCGQGGIFLCIEFPPRK